MKSCFEYLRGNIWHVLHDYQKKTGQPDIQMNDANDEGGLNDQEYTMRGTIQKIKCNSTIAQ